MDTPTSPVNETDKVNYIIYDAKRRKVNSSILFQKVGNVMIETNERPGVLREITLLNCNKTPFSYNNALFLHMTMLIIGGNCSTKCNIVSITRKTCFTY